MNIIKKILGTAVIGGVLLSYNGQVERNHIPDPICSEPLPEITDQNFGTELYRRAINCDRGLIKRLGTSNLHYNAEEVTFRNNGVVYFASISQTSIIVHFMQNPFTLEGLKGYVIDTAPKDAYMNSGYIPNSSNELDSICEVVTLYNKHNEKLSSWVLAMEYTKEEKESAQEICHTVLNGMRDFYNSHLE